ncbi:acyl-[acyl-carrier-protein] thioesterase [Xylocopilactobacillus apicola]|uniref:Acyl-ACP thioesterase n=1 Tax=Xylocopilactobacillus apicola TaxID=2932184 RepID=A0AAU9DFP8_9LACO|nr:acyl-ACP thioesterase domain-containing protein [Xylocopilactobacillus apicola]BDR58770.1 acyl-ACP thioesterase [Xylocopilactobacillus apicola]
MEIFKQEYTVPFFDCDKFRRMTAMAMINNMILVSTRQLESLNYGEKWMTERHLGWVVTQYDLIIERAPQDEEKVVISTWIENYNKFFSYRNFAIETLDGKRLVTLKSVWVALDLEARKLTLLSEEMMKSFGAEKNVVVKTPKISVDQDQLKDPQKFEIRYADLDTNNHITNTSYITWLLESLKIDFLEQHQLKELQIRYEKEIQERDFAEVRFYQDENTDEIKFYHQVARLDKIACQAMTVWQ